LSEEAPLSPLPELTLGELFAEWDVSGRRVPVEGVFEPTFRCNLRCVHCYVNQPAGSAEEQAKELGTERSLGLIDEMADAGCLNLLMTGGEVLLRPDFERIYLHAIGRGLLITVFTNGTLVTDRVAELFDRHRPLLVEISIYGMTAATYERVTGVPGSYERCLAGIRRLHARGVPLALKTMALALNRDEVEDMRRFAEGLGVSFRYDGLLNARVDCGASRDGAQIPPLELLALELEDPAQRAKLENSALHVRQLQSVPSLSFEQVYTCGAGQVSFTVDPYGQMQMCQLSRKASFDLAEERFQTVWDERFGALRARAWQTDVACRTCTLQPLCGSCPGAAELLHGDIEAQVAHFCEIAHLRADALLGDESGHRADATCCLGKGGLTALPAATGCGGCGHSEPVATPLLQIERRRPSA
jgi:radical SAM protein with 4Fe4S-binding SPASM domain